MYLLLIINAVQYISKTGIYGILKKKYYVINYF